MNLKNKKGLEPEEIMPALLGSMDLDISKNLNQAISLCDEAYNLDMDGDENGANECFINAGKMYRFLASSKKVSRENQDNFRELSDACFDVNIDLVEELESKYIKIYYFR